MCCLFFAVTTYPSDPAVGACCHKSSVRYKGSALVKIIHYLAMNTTNGKRHL